MELWSAWFALVLPLRAAFSRAQAFWWFVVALAACSIRSDRMGITSFVRSAWLEGRCYHALRRLFHSSAVKLDDLTKIWTKSVLLALATHLVRVHGQIVLVADGIKAPKEGRKMPGVKSLHQESSSNRKPTYIMGHSWQVVSLLIQKGKSTMFALPLVGRIHEGLVFTNRDRRTLLDRMVEMIDGLELNVPFYLLADAYYTAGKVIRPLLRKGAHLIARLRITTVAYRPPEPIDGKRKRGRPRLYGEKIQLRTLFDDLTKMTEIDSPYEGDDGNITLLYRVEDLLWRPVGTLVRFVLVVHPVLGRRIFLCTDLTCSAIEILTMYSWRFKIEISFRQSIQTLGAYGYRFWMMAMKKIRRGDGNQHLHRKDDCYRSKVRQKINAYHLHVQMALIGQGLLQYLACTQTDAVWQCFRSWLRTIRPGVLPSEFIVSTALRNTFADFLVNCHGAASLRKFLSDKIDPERAPGFGLAA